MTNRIQVLDPFTANQIAAGEVVERPASVVKELVENAIDAGASKVEVAIAGAGVEFIRISDNGFGMNREDAVLAFQRHATSKIRTPADLASIATLGFRGEALPSIASVSRVEVLTREPDALAGTHVLVNGGKIEQIQEVGCPVGTTFIVRDLFFNTPARRKFLKSDATEVGQISDYLGRAAMAYPHIAFKFSNQGRILLLTYGNGNLLEAISQVYGKEAARDMIPIRAEAGNLALEGYLGRPTQSRTSRNYQNFFINGRYIRSKVLTQAVAEGYHTLVPGNRYPMVVLNLTIPLNLVDVNVHPTKLEARFSREAELLTFVADSIRSTLHNSLLISGIPPVELKTVAYSSAVKARPNATDQESKLEVFREVQFKFAHPVEALAKQTEFILETVQNTFPPENRKAVTGQSQARPTSAQALNLGAPDELANAVPQVETEDKTIVPRVSQEIVEDEQREEQVADFAEALIRNSKLPDLIPLGQVDLTYIIARGPQGLYIIDQHAAHERINFEQLWSKVSWGKVGTQMLLEPLTLELSQQEMGLLIENISLFTDLGFLLEHFGGNTFLLRGHPADIAVAEPRTLIRDLLDLLQEGVQKLDPRKLREEFIYTLACKSSIKANDPMNFIEMEHLIWRLGQTENPFTCPHGRPTIIAITTEELARRFQRV